MAGSKEHYGWDAQNSNYNSRLFSASATVSAPNPGAASTPASSFDGPAEGAAGRGSAPPGRRGGAGRRRGGAGIPFAPHRPPAQPLAGQASKSAGASAGGAETISGISTPTTTHFIKHCDGDKSYLIDTRLETWDDPTPRETKCNLEDLRRACIAAVSKQFLCETKIPTTREDRIKRRDLYERKSLMIALEAYTRKNDMKPAGLHLVEVKERNLIDEYGQGFIHFNFLVKGLNGEISHFLAELHPDTKDETGVYHCMPLKENDKAHCYGCKDRAKGLIHPNGGGFLGGHKDVGFPFMTLSDSDDDV